MIKKEKTEKEFKKDFSIIKNSLNNGDFNKALSLYSDFKTLYNKLENIKKYAEAFNVIEKKMILFLKIQECNSLLNNGNYNLKRKIDEINRLIVELKNNKIKVFKKDYDALIKKYNTLKSRRDFNLYFANINEYIKRERYEKAVNDFEKLLSSYNLLVRYEEYDKRIYLRNSVEMIRRKILSMKERKNIEDVKHNVKVDKMKETLEKNDYEKSLKLFSKIYGN